MSLGAICSAEDIPGFIFENLKFSYIFKRKTGAVKVYLPLLVRLYMQYTFRTYSTPVFGTYARLAL